MTLSPGTTLGSFEISGLLGVGGMGEVYRARDTKLGREVAIKVLPEAFAKDRDRLARFEREARLLAQLNHNNIASIYDLQVVEGQRLLIMELVEGSTLADRISVGAIATDEALAIFLQIAEALENAHEQGIIHRDLKPANIKVTDDGKVKVLDFGLAKAFEADPSADDGGTLAMDSDSAGVTGEGKVLGTPAYMSPEQARGQKVDKRTDVWAFGACLYETLSGVRPFKADSASDTMAKILVGEPDWSAVPPDIPFSIQVLLRRCMEKEPRDRLRDMGDARIEIAAALDPTRTSLTDYVSAAGVGTDLWKRAAVIALAGFFIMALFAAVMMRRTTQLSRENASAPVGVDQTAAAKPWRFTITPPADAPLFEPPLTNIIALSPDGSQLVYASGLPGANQLYIRRIGELEARPIAGSEQGVNPFFLAGGRSIGFTTHPQGELKIVSLPGGPARTLAGRASLPGGGAWPRGDVIVYSGTDGIYGVPAEGGSPEPLTAPPNDQDPLTHVYPQVLPGGRAMLFTAFNEGENADEADIAVFDFESGQWRTIIRGGYHARYVPTGHLVYARGTTLFARPFDLARLEPTGPPVPVVEGIASDPLFGAGNFSFASDGTLAYVAARSHACEPVWVDRKGNETPLGLPPRVYLQHDVSPDGTQVAFAIFEDNRYQIWIYDIERGVLSRLALEGENAQPVWSPDGERIAHTSSRGGGWRLYISSSDGRRSVQEPFGAAADLTYSGPGSWSPDGKKLTTTQTSRTSGETDIKVVGVDGGAESVDFTTSSHYQVGAEFSPDGRGIAYSSFESGGEEIYFRAFPGPGRTIQVSSAGGYGARWSPDGSELYYRSGAKVMVVAIETGDEIRFGKPEVLFEGKYVGRDFYDMANYDIAPDGRFLMLKPAGDQEASGQIVIVQNWFEELERLVPIDRD